MPLLRSEDRSRQEDDRRRRDDEPARRVELVARDLSLDAVLCNRFEVDAAGLHTGRPLGGVVVTGDSVWTVSGPRAELLRIDTRNGEYVTRVQ